MNDVAVGTVRLRGPHARRLARVAATTLPTALDRSLADLADRHVGTLVVPLDLDVSAHDDETIAVLWADAIRTRLLAVAPSAADGVAGRPTPPVVPATAARPTAIEVLAAAQAWSSAPGPGAHTLPAALLALADPATARQLAGELGDATWSRLLARLAALLAVPAVAPSPSADERDGARPVREQAPADDPTRAANDDRWPGATGDQPPPSGEPRAATSDLLELVGALAELVGDEPSGRDIDLDTVSRAAGLVLLYPWLADHCREATELHPQLDPVAVREAALAVLVDPADATQVDDPLVRLLAGRTDPTSPEPSAPRVPLDRAEEVGARAEQVLASYAALLPGFERSTPTFVRQAWISRLGLLDDERDPVQLTASTHPLDVMLPALPYPLGLIKLPWSVPLAVRFRP